MLDGDRSSATSWATSTRTLPRNSASCIWRINVAADAQGKGVGRFAVQALRRRGARPRLQAGHRRLGAGEDGPEEFFKAVGFKVVGETPYGENLGALTL